MPDYTYRELVEIIFSRRSEAEIAGHKEAGDNSVEDLLGFEIDNNTPKKPVINENLSGCKIDMDYNSLKCEFCHEKAYCRAILNYLSSVEKGSIIILPRTFYKN